MTEIPEIVIPLGPLEASLIKTVGEFRERERQRLEVEWQKIQLEANNRIAPVLQLHGVGPGDEFEIRDDATSSTGLSLAVKKGTVTAPAPTPVTPLKRTDRRRLEKTISKKTKRVGGR